MSDFIRLEGLPGRFPWDGEFPPPETIWYCTGTMTGFKAIIVPDAAPNDMLEQIRANLSIETTVYKRVSYSQISDEDIKTMTHVARGASYEAVPHGD